MINRLVNIQKKKNLPLDAFSCMNLHDVRF